jgi:hypothetical protein
MLQKLRSQLTPKSMALVVVGLVAIPGIIFLGGSRAAAPFISAEPESGTINSPASKITDSAASGGSAVGFAAVTPPSPPPVGFCDTFPSQPSVKPDATNTGVPAGTTLTNYTGPATISTAGTVIDSKIITNQLTINANNVTIKNSKLGPGSYWTVLVNDGITGTKVINNEVYAPNGNLTGISMGDGIICGNHIHGYENGITIGGNMIVQANYIHGLKGDGSTTPHYDCIEVYSGSNIKVVGNNLNVSDPNGNWLDETGALNITTEWSNIDNVEAYGNWFAGGSYSLYVRKSGSGNSYRYTNINIHNNRWIRNSYAYGPASTDGGVTNTANVFDDNGAAVTF